MLNKNKIVRNVIFLLFCVLILIVSSALTYYVAFYDESNFKIDEISSGSTTENYEEYDCEDDDYTDLIGGLFYKFSAAFIAGSLLSDKVFLKLGLI